MKRSAIGLMMAVLALGLGIGTPAVAQPVLSGSILTINGGAAATNNPNVTLTYAAWCFMTPLYGNVDFSNDGSNWSGSAYFNGQDPLIVGWTLTPGDGSKTVWANFPNYGASASILLETTIPGDGAVTVYLIEAADLLLLTWSGFSAPSGIGSYQVYHSTSGYPSTSGTLLYQGPETSFFHQNLDLTQSHYYRVVAVSNAGNVSAGATAAATNCASAVRFAINGGEAYTNSPNATLTLNPAGLAGPVIFSEGSVSQTGTVSACTDLTMPWTLAAGDGPKTVQAALPDGSFINAAVTVDSIPPVDGSLTANIVNLNPMDYIMDVSLQWQGFSDAICGIQTYRLYYSNDSPPSASGTPIYEGTGTSFVQQELSYYVPAYYRLVAVDNAGNVSAGATAEILSLGMIRYRPLPFLQPLLLD